jgi:integrase
MQKLNPRNERVKRKYYDWMREAKGRSDATIDQAAAAIDRYETYAKHADFKSFHIEKVKAFKVHLSEQRSTRNKTRLSHATIYSTLNALKAFFEWLAGQPGYKRYFSFGDWDYFSPTGQTASIAKAHRPSRAPPVATVRRVLGLMPTATEIEQRDRAIVAFLLLTAARVSAVASFQIGHVNINDRSVFQDARAVRTKKAKSFETTFFPVDDNAEQILIEWVGHLVSTKGWGPNDPLFPRTRVALDDTGQFAPDGLERAAWTSTGPIRAILRSAFERAGVPYPNPHSFRETIATYGRENCKTLADMQAWAQNLGHESATTTFGSYAKLSPKEQAKLVRSVGE